MDNQGDNLNQPSTGITSTMQDAIPPVTEKIDKDFQDLMDFRTAKVRLQILIADFQPVIQRAKDNRSDRFKDINIKALRDKQELKPDQFLLPVRAIESNIRREQPAYINYLKQSRRLVIFKDLLNPLQVTTRLEDEFTRGMTYSGWETPHFKCVDGSQTHGWDAVEVVFDTTKPLHVGIEHVGNDRLFFPTDTQDIQQCELILRSYEVTTKQLKNLAKNFGFNEVEINKLIEKQSALKKERTTTIYKKFCKYDDVVYVAWFSLICDDWLKAPVKLFVGRKTLSVRQVPIETPVVDPQSGQPMLDINGQPMTQTEFQNEEYWEDIEESSYPIFILPYNETEMFRILSHKGRVFLDKHKQEAKTANLSQFLNGCQRASQMYPYLDGEFQRSQKEIESIKIGDGIVPAIPIKYYTPPYPESQMLNLQQYLDTFDSQEVGQVNFAAMNRQDSRKTATEVNAAQQEAGNINSVQLTLYSTFIREVYTYAWEIVKSQAAQQRITFLASEDGKNDINTLNRIYDIKAAGDIDVVKRQELISQYKDFWPIVQNTPIALPFLSRLIRLVFPEEGDLYAKMLEAGDPRILITQLAAVLRSSIDDDEFRLLSPQEQQNLMMLLQQADMMNPANMGDNKTAAGSTSSSPVEPRLETQQVSSNSNPT